MIDKSFNEYMHKFIEDICNEIGPRESGTEQELQCGNRIEDELKKYCHKTHQEEYVSSPHAFLGGIRYGVLLVFVAIIFYWIILLRDLMLIQFDESFNLMFLTISVIFIIVTVSYFFLEVMKYHEIFDFLFPNKISKNIIGTINPTGEIKNTIIFSAHHDSAFEFNTFYYLKKFGYVIIFGGYLALGLIFLGIILRLIFLLLLIEFLMLFAVLGILYLVFTPILLFYLFFHSYKPVPGAFDNLSAVSVVLGIAKYLSENKNNNETFPKHTQVQLISFAGEEAGLRGSKRYIKAHYDELITTHTKVVNMDGIAQKDHIIIHNKEPGIGVKHDPEIYELLLKIANDLNIKAKLASLPFGATDGAAFSKEGIPAADFGSMNLREVVSFYHTRLDTPDVVEKEGLGQVLQICLEYLKRIDKSI